MKRKWYVLFGGLIFYFLLSSGIVFSGGTQGTVESATIRAMDWAAGGTDFWNKTDKNFMSLNPTVKVEHEFVLYTAYWDKIGAYITANDGPDLITFEPGNNLFKYIPVLVPLDSYVRDYIDDIRGIDVFCEDFDTTKTLYGVPYTNQAHLVYYNKLVFKEAGLDTENPPRTWSEFDATVKAVKKLGKEGIAFGGKTWAAVWTWCCLPNQLLTPEEKRGIYLGTTKWTGPKLKNTVRLLNDMYERGWFNEGAAMMNVIPESQDLFVNNQAAFFNSISSDNFNWKMWGDLMGYDNFGVMKFPKIEKDFPLKSISPQEPGASSLAIYGGIGYGILKWSKHINVSSDYLKYIASPEVQKRYLVEGGAVPANKKTDVSIITESPQFQKIMKWYDEDGPNTSAPGLIFMSPEEWDGVMRQTQLLLSGQTNVDEYCQALQEAADRARATR